MARRPVSTPDRHMARREVHASPRLRMAPSPALVRLGFALPSRLPGSLRRRRIPIRYRPTRLVPAASPLWSVGVVTRLRPISPNPSLHSLTSPIMAAGIIPYHGSSTATYRRLGEMVGAHGPVLPTISSVPVCSVGMGARGCAVRYACRPFRQRVLERSFSAAADMTSCMFAVLGHLD